MITIDGAFLTAIGVTEIFILQGNNADAQNLLASGAPIATVNNTDVDSQYEWHFRLVMSNAVTVYNRYDFYLNSPVNGVYYDNQKEWYEAIGELYSENIYDQYSFFQNVSFDGITPIYNQYSYYKGVSLLTPGSSFTPSGLVAYYNMENFNDSVSSFNMTSNGSATSVSGGMVGNRMAFDITNTDITSAMVATGSNCPFTSVNTTATNSWSGWFNFTLTSSIKVLCRLMGTLNRLIDVRRDSTSWYIVVYSDSIGQQSYQSIEALPLSTWTHVCFVQNTTSLKLYINNTLKIDVINTNNGTGGPGGVWDFNSFTIGNTADFNLSIIGYADEFGYWDRELTLSEVSELYNGGAGKFYP